MVPTLSYSSWQWESGDGTLSDVTSPPDDTSMIESFFADLKEGPRGAELLVAGDFNVNLLEPEGGWRGEEIVVALTT